VLRITRRYDWHNLRGSPYFMRLGTGIGRPKEDRLGVDFAGVVEAVGAEVNRFAPGDEVFGGPSGDWLGPLTPVLAAAMTSLFVDQELGMMVARLRQESLAALAELMEDGKVRPVLDRRYELAEVPEAIRYSDTGRARGKIIITLAD
jgi:NADPH:quinone reductase-like Zn-dependent oxidoreductase